MYLSKIDLDPGKRLARKYLSSPQVMHAVVLKATGGSGSPSSEGRVLWRVDKGHGGISLLILSPTSPDLSLLEAEAGLTGSSARTLDYRPFLHQIEVGQQWAFRLAANPARAISQGAGQRGKVHGHVTVAQQRQWLADRTKSRGFQLLSTPGVDAETSDITATVASREKPVFGRQNPDGHSRDRVTINRTVFEGQLRVTDPEVLRTTLVRGMGRSKAYGCGLLTLARIPQE